MSFAILALMAFWAASVGVALLVARDRLATGGRPTWRAEALARGAAFVGATGFLGALWLFLNLLGPPAEVVPWLPLAWFLSITPLFLPPTRRVPSPTLIGASVGLTVASALSTAIALLVRLALTPF